MRLAVATTTSVLVVVASLVLTAPAALASGVPYHTGDVFAGIGNGNIGHYSANGVIRLETLDSGTNSLQTTGMTFDKTGNLYGTDFQAGCADPLNCGKGPAGAISKYDPAGTSEGKRVMRFDVCQTSNWRL
jgi:hypothetical protein